MVSTEYTSCKKFDKYVIKNYETQRIVSIRKEFKNSFDAEIVIKSCLYNIRINSL